MAFVRSSQHREKDESVGFASFSFSDDGRFAPTVALGVHSSKDVMFIKEIGGGMLGTVFLAKTLNTHAMCCVKVMQKWKVTHLDQGKTYRANSNS